MNELVIGILTEYFAKLKSFSVMAWSVCVLIVAALYALLSGSLGIPLAEPYAGLVAKYGVGALTFLTVAQEGLKQSKNHRIASAIKKRKRGTNTRGLMPNDDEDEPQILELERALKI